MNCCFGGRYGLMTNVGLRPEGREKIKPSPDIILYREARELIHKGRINSALDVLCELEVHNPKRENELLRLM